MLLLLLHRVACAKGTLCCSYPLISSGAQPGCISQALGTENIGNAFRLHQLAWPLSQQSLQLELPVLLLSRGPGETARSTARNCQCRGTGRKTVEPERLFLVCQSQCPQCLLLALDHRRRVLLQQLPSLRLLSLLPVLRPPEEPSAATSKNDTERHLTQIPRRRQKQVLL